MAKHLNAYDRALLALRDKLEKMGQLAGERLSQAMQAFVAQDEEQARLVLAGDDEIDILDEELEMEALELISLQQPVDYELRFLSAVIRVSREFERIADYACDIAEATLQLEKGKPFFKPLIDLPRLAELVQGLMRKAFQAHVIKDLVAAGELDEDDDQIDQLFLNLVAELTDFIKKEPECVDQAIKILLVSRYLERVGDHVVNIGEMIIFTETGERHPFKRAKRKARNGE